MKRQIVLDTETTGIQPELGHRIVEIGCVELLDRKVTGNTYHQYINPERDMDDEVIKIHGLTNQFLADKPVFADIAADFVEFVSGAELLIHNAAFDVGFINHELARLKQTGIDQVCSVVDTLALARAKHPGAKANLDALCRRYQIDNSARVYHGALLDSEILAEVYLRMTGGQVTFALDAQDSTSSDRQAANSAAVSSIQLSGPLKVIRASEEDSAAHDALLEKLRGKAGDGLVWDRL